MPPCPPWESHDDILTAVFTPKAWQHRQPKVADAILQKGDVKGKRSKKYIIAGINGRDKRRTLATGSLRRRRYTPQPRVAAFRAYPGTDDNIHTNPEGVSQMTNVRVNPTRTAHPSRGYTSGKATIFILKRLGLMMFNLIGDVMRELTHV